MPFNLFKFRSVAPIAGGHIGIDIGTSAIKVVELDKRGGRFNLVNYGIFEFKGVGSNDGVGSSNWENILKMPDREVSQGIKELLKRAGIKTTDAVVSIPSFSTFATVIEMPYISNEALVKAIPFEAKKYIPLPLDEVVLDWSIVEVLDQKQLLTNTTKPSSIEVFLAAVPKEETARYQNIMNDVGVNMQAIELENSALVRALLGNDLSPTAIVNVGGRSTSIFIVDKGYERLSRNYEIGGFEITKSVAQSLGVNLEKAEELKRKLGLTSTDENIIADSIKPLIDLIVFETEKIIANYEEMKKTKILNIILAGGLVNMPDFGRYFKNKLGRNIIIGNFFSRVAYPKELELFVSELSNTLSVAAGLAMREI